MENKKARHMHKSHIARPVIEADCIVNLCRPKSHVEAGYTGAVKNYWGIIPGGEKARCHLYGRNPDEFGAVLVDNYQTLLGLGKKRIVVMDARKFMEGPGGPANGYMRKVGLVLAGYDEAAIDTVMLAIGRIDGPRAVPHLKSCAERGLGVTCLDEIEIRGKSIAEVRLKRKAGIISTTIASLLNNFVTRTVVYKCMRRMPDFAKKEACVMCGDCYNICPNNAISWQKKEVPIFEKEKCVSCLCCVECCPQQVLKAKPAGFSGLFLKYPEINLPHE
jgi:ferredoxin